LQKQTGVYVTIKPLGFYRINFQQTSKIDNIYQKYLIDYAVINNNNNILIVLKESISLDSNYQSYSKKLQGFR